MKINVLLIVGMLGILFDASADGFKNWSAASSGSVVQCDSDTLAVMYDSPDYKPVRVTPAEPIVLPDNAVRLTTWFGSSEGDAYVRLLVKDASGKVHTVEMVDGRIHGRAIEHDPRRRGEWSFWNFARSTSLYMPTEAELKERLSDEDCDRMMQQLWPKPLTLVGAEIVPQKPGERWGGLYTAAQRKAVDAGTGTIWIRFPQSRDEFPRDADFYACIKDRYRPVQDESVFFFPDDFTELDQTDIRYQLDVYAGYNGPTVWHGAGEATVNRTDPVALFKHRIDVPKLPVGTYFIDAKTWMSDGAFSGMRRFMVWVGNSRADKSSDVSPGFSLTTGCPKEVCPAGTTSVVLKVTGEADRNQSGEFQFKVMDYTGATVAEQVVPSGSGEISISVPVTGGTDYFGEVRLVAGGKTLNQAVCHFGVAGVLETPKGTIPDSIPPTEEFLAGKAHILAEYYEPNHVSMAYPYTQTFDFSDFKKWTKQVKELGPQTLASVKAGWPNIEPLPGVFRWGIFDQETELLRKQDVKIVIGYTPYGGSQWVPRWVGATAMRNQFGDFMVGHDFVYPLDPMVKNGWYEYLRQLVSHYYTDEHVFGYAVFNTPFFGEVRPEPCVTDYSQAAQDEFNQWLSRQGKDPAPLTPLLVIPGVATKDQGADLSPGWRDFIDFCSYTTYENTRGVLELIRGVDSKRQIFVDRKSNPYAVEQAIPLVKKYNAVLKNEGSPGFRDAMMRSMAIQDGVPFVSELHRHVPTSRSISDAANYFSSYCQSGSLWLMRWAGAMMEPGWTHPIQSLIRPNYPFVQDTQTNWNEYLSGTCYEPEVLVVGSRTDALVNGQRRGFFDDISGREIYSALFEWQQVPVHFANEYCNWVDFSKFKLIFAGGEVMPQKLIDKLATAAKSGVKIIVVGDAGSIAQEKRNSSNVLADALRGLSNVKFIDPPARITAGTAWDTPVGWKANDVNSWLEWAGVRRPVSITADKQPGFQAQVRSSNDGIIYLAVLRNYYGWYRNNIEFEDALFKKYGKVAGQVTLPVGPGTWRVDKFHREQKHVGEFKESDGAIEFPLDPAVAGEVQLLRIQKIK